MNLFDHKPVVDPSAPWPGKETTEAMEAKLGTRVIDRYVHHGVDVAVIYAVKGRHREHCLCFQGCVHFKPGRPDNCKIAQDTYDNCVKHGLTTPVFECPKYAAS